MEVVDPLMEEVVNVETLWEIFDLAFQCAGPMRNDRPDMKLVAEELWAIRTDYLKSNERGAENKLQLREVSSPLYPISCFSLSFSHPSMFCGYKSVQIGLKPNVVPLLLKKAQFKPYTMNLPHALPLF
ncbi:hypothetical protein SLEP1_g14992 [Rubroshorea leprosula]|uniref:Uncharacterized protein n=1 Tax=Rubroshorea leprosula TaxID=152421 RepID=A0AAV5IWC9_9ROSI|nr:hypothetical protein SLEP1_g14992 [Rubroshorea leprosula]